MRVAPGALVAIVGAGVLLLAGCAGAPVADADAADAVACATPQACDELMVRAQTFVMRHSPYRLWHVSADKLQTQGPEQFRQDLALTVTRERDADGHGHLRLHAECGNVFACEPSARALAQTFREELAGAAPALSGR